MAMRQGGDMDVTGSTFVICLKLDTVAQGSSIKYRLGRDAMRLLLDRKVRPQASSFGPWIG